MHEIQESEGNTTEEIARENNQGEENLMEVEWEDSQPDDSEAGYRKKLESGKR